ncbi:GNAT family N-acetyltransferase [Gordonia sp. PKS22-38]|uniref:GNAT family N-acetyltransferase n=1 Tax=Gordonia prachuapensis TaxID=3115651 RepID=A0ABU7MQU8_9ACTN|nr:GNAT family N-acetyltransferase [Gordonia sp. PKS22-38]
MTSDDSDALPSGDRVPFVGDRVVVRYRLGDATPADWRGEASAALSDVTGILLDDGDPLVVDRDGPQSIPRSAVVSIRQLSRVTVRNSEIRRLESAAADGWPGTDTATISGWALRAGGGFTRRANSAVPLEFGSGTDEATLAAVRGWYRARGLPTLVALPERLVPAGQIDGRPISGEIQVLVRDVDVEDSSTPSDVRLDDAPTSAWLRAYRGPEVDVPTAAAVVAASRGPVVFASLGDAEPQAIGRATVTSSPDGVRWLGVSALWTAPSRRREGLANAVLTALIAWGARQDAARIHVQVEAENRTAGTWYRRHGFGLHHTSRYLEL